MEVSGRLKRRLRHRQGSRLRRSHRAVVSVVGTLLALLVFFALFGVFITQYVPVWMGDNEAAFTAQLQASLAQLKANIDLQTTLLGPPEMSAPFTLSSQGIPLVATPTGATMNYIPRAQGEYVNVTMQYGPSGNPGFFQNLSLGTIQVSVPNRYFSPQTLQYEADAVIQSQGDTNQVLLYPPDFYVNTTGSHSSASLGLLQLYGNATQVVSSGTIEVYSHFGAVQQFPSNGTLATPGSPFRVSITVGTLYPCAWATYFNQSLAQLHVAPSAYTLSPSTCVPANGKSVPVRLTLLALNSFDLILASFTVQIGVGQS